METSTLLHQMNLLAANLVLIVLGLSVLFFLFKYKKLDVPFRRLFYFLAFNLTIEILALVFQYAGINNLPLLHLYTLLEFILFSFFFKSIFVEKSFFHRVFWYLIVVVSVLIICNSIFVQPIFEFNTLAKSGVQIILICYAIVYFYNLVEPRRLSTARFKSIRLVNSAIIIYYSGSLFIFMFSRDSIWNEEVYVIFWTFNGFLNLVFQLLIFTALWIAYYRKTPSPQ